MTLRICIFGAGASGGHFAVRLALAGHVVCVVARGEHLQAVRRDGLRLLQGGATLAAEIAASDDPRELGPQDIVIVAVKANALPAVADTLAPLIGTDTRVLFAQNGMAWWYPLSLPARCPRPPDLPQFALAERFLAFMRPAQVFPAIVYSANEIVAPGVIRNNSPSLNALDIGCLDPAEDDRLADLRSVLQAAGLASRPVGDVRAALWQKLVLNAAASSIAVATGNASAIAIDAAVRALFVRIVDECAAVAAAHGYPLQRPIDVSRWTNQRAGHKPSLLQDFEAGRPMEMAEMVLAPGEFARSLGLATPSLDAAAAIASRRAIDRGGASHGETLARLQSLADPIHRSGA